VGPALLRFKNLPHEELGVEDMVVLAEYYSVSIAPEDSVATTLAVLRGRTGIPDPGVPLTAGSMATGNGEIPSSIYRIRPEVSLQQKPPSHNANASISSAPQMMVSQRLRVDPRYAPKPELSSCCLDVKDWSFLESFTLVSNVNFDKRGVTKKGVPTCCQARALWEDNEDHEEEEARLQLATRVGSSRLSTRGASATGATRRLSLERAW